MSSYPDTQCHGYSSRWTAKHVIFAGAVGGASLVALTRHKLLKVHAESNPWEVSPRPEPTPSRVMNYGLDLGIKITLYQYQTCPFCCKARAFLDYYGISYDVVEVNSVKRTEVKWSKYKKVPLLLVQTPEGKTVQINDSSQIVSVLQTFIDTKMKITIDQIANYYPHFEDKGEGMFARTTFDFPNK
jgi:microsomal prostaglandin-E synthase 2